MARPPPSGWPRRRRSSRGPPAARVLSFATMADTKPLEQLYLIAGSDTPKVRRAVARLRKRVHDETASDLNIFVFDGRVVRAAAVLEEAQTPTFALGTRLLLVFDADRWPAADRDKLADYLADPAPDTCLALVGASFKKTERLTKLAEKHKAVLRYDLPKRYELPDWVRERAQAKTLHLGRAEAQHLLDWVGSDPESLESEIEKLALYSPGGHVSVADIDEVCVQSLEASIFQLMDAVGKRDARGAFRALEILYSRGEDQFSVFFMLLRHIRQLRTAHRPAVGYAGGGGGAHPRAWRRSGRRSSSSSAATSTAATSAVRSWRWPTPRVR